MVQELPTTKSVSDRIWQQNMLLTLYLSLIGGWLELRAGYEGVLSVAVAIFLRLGVDCPRVIRRVLSRAPPFTSERER